MKPRNYAAAVLLWALGGAAALTGIVVAAGTPPATTATGAPQDCQQDDDDARLRCLLRAWKVSPLHDPAPVSDALFNAGRALFEGPSGQLLSGPRSISCASCHPTNNAGVETAFALRLGLDGGALHRNAPGLVNLLMGDRNALFWDGRVSRSDDGGWASPAGSQLPQGLDSLLAVQSLFPLLSRDEMLGYHDVDSNGSSNDLANLNPEGETVESNPWPVWNAIAARVRADATLAPLLQAAYPAIEHEQIGIEHIGNALAAYQTRRWNAPRQPAFFHAYVAGKQDLSAKAMRGALLFFGQARCASCHNGPLLSDGRFHNLAVPHIGPGFASGREQTPPRDWGRFDVSGDTRDKYAFLTPSLWEVRGTAPYMHNGVYSTLEQVLRHHLNPTKTTQRFRCADKRLSTGTACHDSVSAPAMYAEMLATLAPELREPVALSDAQIADLVGFMRQLTNGAN